jgi:hypothetical protein
MSARRRGLSKVISRRVFWRLRRHGRYRGVPLIRGGKQRRHLGESFFGQSILELHRASADHGRGDGIGGGWTDGRRGAAGERVWLLETGSSTHNEFRLAARPLSGDRGASTPLLINTRAGWKSATGAGRDDFQTRFHFDGAVEIS